MIQTLLKTTHKTCYIETGGLSKTSSNK